MSLLPNSPLPLLLPSLPFQHRVKLITAYLLMLRTLEKKEEERNVAIETSIQPPIPSTGGEPCAHTPVLLGGSWGAEESSEVGDHAQPPPMPNSAPPASLPCPHSLLCLSIYLSVHLPSHIPDPWTPVPAARSPSSPVALGALSDGCFDAPLGGRFFLIDIFYFYFFPTGVLTQPLVLRVQLSACK